MSNINSAKVGIFLETTKSLPNFFRNNPNLKTKNFGCSILNVTAKTEALYIRTTL